ncbi:uncharacterized protein METZ01_LOCUS208281, partial [marine metagenome]
VTYGRLLRIRFVYIGHAVRRLT